MTELTIALTGNPNTGKSTVFNALTGSHQHVGNWPGKTVEKKEGFFEYKGLNIRVIDLPGTYSLSAYSLEEQIARDFIVKEKPALVVNVTDAANLERNLYLTTQILETGAPMIIALNMTDIANARGLKIDARQLSNSLDGISVIKMTARKGQGLDDLKEAIVTAAQETHRITLSSTPAQVDYGEQIERELKELSRAIAQTPNLRKAYNPRWLAIQLLEGDKTLLAEVTALTGDGKNVSLALEAGMSRLKQLYGEEVDVMLADRRYNFVNARVQDAVIRSSAAGALTTSDRIDKIVTHRWLGIPIFLALMWVVFKTTTDVAAPYLDWVGSVITGPVSRCTISLLGLIGLGETWVESLFVDGILAGVGGVLVFVPVLMSLYLALAVLEDSGYMSRAAFVMDRLMSVIGLHGKSFLPMVVGFGCTVPAIYATRTLKSEKDRILTGLLVPFMSCSARLPVYILFAAIFFPRYGGLVVFSLYLLGVLTAIALGLLLKNTLFKGKEQTPFVMELPPYRVPNPKSVWLYMWKRTASFIHNAWTIILATSIVIWVLMAIPMGGGKFAAADINQSAFAAVSGAITPMFKPLGFGSWQASGSLITGFVAKEVVVSTMAQVYGVEEAAAAAEETETTTFIQDAGQVITSFIGATMDTLKSIPLIVGINLFDEADEEEPTALMGAIHAGFETASNGHAALAAFAFLVFVLLYTPCMVAIAAARHEFGLKWMWISVIGQFVLAWLMAFVIFQGGKLLRLG